MARLLWQQRQDIGPHPRYLPGMTYVPPTAKSLLWGGFFESTTFGDTWEWDGEGWVQVADTGPAPFGAVGLAFDSVRNVTVLFSSDPTGTVWETWEWDGDAWTQVDDIGPQAAAGTFQMVYDGARQVTLLEGGAMGTGSPQSPSVGTWLWDGSTWTQVADLGPPQRVLAALAFDASRERVVHFGGANADGSYQSDTWEWDGTDWEQVTNMGPRARLGHAMTGTSEATLLFGGIAPSVPNTPLELFRDTWAWDGTFWRQRQDMGPAPRLYFAMSWDGARQRGVLFGGVTLVGGTASYLNDTWESFEVA